MRRAVSWGVLGVVPAVAVWLAVAGSAGAADFDAARHAIGEMTAASRAVVDSGDRGDFGRMITDAERVVEAGERALAALPRPGNRHAETGRPCGRPWSTRDKSSRLRPTGGLTTRWRTRRALTQVRRGGSRRGVIAVGGPTRSEVDSDAD
jgi:hypothetical protein